MATFESGGESGGPPAQALGGAGIVVGLATYGYKIMNAMGVKLVTITPSRGYCIELGAAFVIIYGTAQGWPLSTTHCQIGATVAVGLFEGAAGVNGRLFAKTRGARAGKPKPSRDASWTSRRTFWRRPDEAVGSRTGASAGSSPSW